jgi:hypothetical protein
MVERRIRVGLLGLRYFEELLEGATGRATAGK